MNQISSCQHCIFIECIHEIISWCQCHDSLNGKHLFYRQWCWNHIWFVRSCSQFRMVPIIAYPEFIETTCKNHVQWFAVIDFIMFNEQYEHDSRECQKAKQRASRIEKPCRAWNALEDARSMGDDMLARAWGMLDEMMLTACPRRWLRFRPAGHTGQGLAAVMPPRVHALMVPSCPTPSFPLPSSGWFQKKCGAVTTVLFFFFLRASPRWRRTIPEARRGMPETAICTWFILVAGTYRKMRTYCCYLYVHIVSEAMVLSKPEWDGFLRWFLPIVIIEEMWTLTLSSLVSSVNRSWCMMV